jgi:septin family protein
MNSTLHIGKCKKKCVESLNETDCKVCDTGEDRDKCLECNENYERSKDKKSCVPTFLVYGNKRYDNCKKYIKSKFSSGCEEGNFHYIIQNGT